MIELTLPIIEARCAMEAACWIWTQGTTGTGAPCARSNNKVVLVRREAYRLFHGHVQEGYFVISTCRNRLCVSPHCAKALTGRSYIRWLNDQGYLNNEVHKVVCRAAQARRSRVPREAVQAIRERIAAGEDRGKVAEEFGISRSYANRIASGYCRRLDLAPNASVFAISA